VSERQRGATLGFVKAHAYGNDFLFIEEDDVGAGPLDGLARAICRRRHGIGADGLIVYRRTPAGAAMRLFNADGSRAEVSGNGVRCLGALLVDSVPGAAAGATAGPLAIETEGGLKTLALLRAEPPRYTFRAGMGQPLGLREEELTVGGELVRVVLLSVGNPQCVVLSSSMDEVESRFWRLGRLLATHDRFPEGTNVEFATVERRDRIRILIWERGVGPTLASGTGACAAAVAAARYGGAARSAEVVSPGGAQRVDWTEEEIRLTGWADIVARGRWIPPLPSP
jgi:diaminopimelate epimerase